MSYSKIFIQAASLIYYSKTLHCKDTKSIGLNAFKTPVTRYFSEVRHQRTFYEEV